MRAGVNGALRGAPDGVAKELATCCRGPPALGPRKARLEGRSSELLLASEAPRFMDTAAATLLPHGKATELNGSSREFRATAGALGAV